MSTNFKEAISSIDAVVSEYEALKKEVSDKLKDRLKDVFKAFFDAHPDVKTIHWLQYTPYFNDGDECVFSINEFNYTSSEWNDIEDVYGEEDELAFSSYRSSKKKLEGQMLQDARNLENTLSGGIYSEVMEEAFGNGAWVRAHRGGFEVEEYSDHH